jgi:hypothetical protein
LSGIARAVPDPGGGATACRARTGRLRWAALALAVLLVGGPAGCVGGPADRDAARRAWAERDAERQRECRQARGGWVAGGCVFGGGP